MIEPSSEEWRELYAAAAELGRLEPWTWMSDGELFGVRDPATGEIGWCSVIGALGTRRGLVVHRGSEGLDIYGSVARGEHAPGDVFGIQHALTAFLGSRDDLDRTALERIRALCLRFRGAHAWPDFESHLPGFAPWRVARDEAVFLALALREALVVCARAAREPESLRGPGPGLLVREPVAGGPTRERFLAPEPFVPPPLPAFEDGARAAQLVRNCARTDSTWECEYAYLPNVVHERGMRPFHGALALFGDRDSGVLVHLNVEEPPLSGVSLRAQLLDVLRERRVLPARIEVRSRLAHAALAPVAEALGVELARRDSLPMIGEVRAMLERAI